MTAVISACIKKNLSKLVNFCVAILILKMEENKQNFGRLCSIISRKVKTAETQKKICAVYAEGAVTDRMCPKWFVNFHAGDFLLGDAPQSGRPVEVDNDQTETLTENSQCYTTWELADILTVSKSIKLLVKMKNVSSILQKKLNGLFG